MFASDEEMAASEPEPMDFPYWQAYDESFLWRAPRDTSPAAQS